MHVLCPAIRLFKKSPCAPDHKSSTLGERRGDPDFSTPNPAQNVLSFPPSSEQRSGESLVNQRKKTTNWHLERFALKTENWSPSLASGHIFWCISEANQRGWKSKSWLSSHFWWPSSKKKKMNWQEKKAELAWKCYEKIKAALAWKCCEKKQKWHENVGMEPTRKQTETH